MYRLNDLVRLVGFLGRQERERDGLHDLPQWSRNDSNNHTTTTTTTSTTTSTSTSTSSTTTNKHNNNDT